MVEPRGSLVPPFGLLGRAAYIAAQTDAYFTCPARSIARALAGTHTVPVYRYFYTHAYDEGPYMRDGAAHGYELPLLFHVFDPMTFPTGASAAEHELSDDLIGYWTRFAATGDPSGSGAVPWPVYDPVADSYLTLDDPFSAGTALRTALCNFWNANGY